MSIISEALERDRDRELNPEGEAAPTPRRASSGDVIGKRSPAAKTSKSRRESVSSPRYDDAMEPGMAPGRLILFLGGFLGLAGIGIGFFMGGNLTSSGSGSSGGEAAKAVAAAPIEKEIERQTESSEHEADASEEADNAKPRATPVTVRVEVSVKTEESKPQFEILPMERAPYVEPAFPDLPSRSIDYDIPPEPVVPREPPPPPMPKTLTVADVREMFQLEGIMAGDDDPMAVINGEIMREGYEADGFRVKKINSHTVLIDYKGKEYELR